MASYIKRADVMKICQSYSSHCFMANDSNGQDIADRIEDDVVELPIAKVKEVKRGHWMPEKCNHKPYRYKNPEKWNLYKCSKCGYSNGRKQSNFCPNCGADMRGGADANI